MANFTVTDSLLPSEHKGGRTDRLRNWSDGFSLRFIIGLTFICVCQSVGAETLDARKSLTREGQKPQIWPQSKSLYQKKLFLTKDEVARYVFLTNKPNDGDRSAAVYRAPGRSGSLDGDYWITVTQASDSIDAETYHPNITVIRSDAPLPASTARAVHELWLAVLERTRVEKDVVLMAPTVVFAVQDARGKRLEAVSYYYGEETPLPALMQIGAALVEYPHLPAVKRLEAAKRIEKDSYSLLNRITKDR